MYWIVKTRSRTMVATVALLASPVAFVMLVTQHGDPSIWVKVVWLVGSLVSFGAFPVLVCAADKHYQWSDAEGLRSRVRNWIGSLPSTRNG